MVDEDVKHRHQNGSSTLQHSSPDTTNHDVTHNKNVNISGVPFIPKSISSTIMIIGPPLFSWFYWYSCNSHGGSLMAAGSEVGAAMSQEGFGNFWSVIYSRIPSVSLYAVKLYCVWFLWQAILYAFLPGPIGIGQATPAGHELPYNCNGLRVWVLTHITAILLVKYDVIRASVIANNWGAFFVVTNLAGFLFTILVYVKAHVWPTHVEDRCFSGSLPYDLFMGIEHNPRIGEMFDFKLFFNGRPGICAWTLINLSFAAKQYETFGFVSNSMILLNILHAIYVLDFFYNEDWYLRTMDIAHDHFGFYLAWGDLVWLPFMYTIQSFYLSVNPVHLPFWALLMVSFLALGGYAIFRSVNHQKNTFRMALKEKRPIKIWGRTAEYIPAKFTTTFGMEKESPLLCSGWWGVSRHFNYVGDLMGSLSYCLTCGFAHFLPYFYIWYMAILLVHRTYRDDIRCRQKYGKYWEEYCRRVPYKILPYVF